MKMLLQQYDDGTFGYFGIDGDKYEKYDGGAKVVCTQGEDEDRREFIRRNRIEYKSKQYGSDLRLDRKVNDGNYRVRYVVARRGYGLDKIINDKSYFVREAVARQGYGLEKQIDDKDWSVRYAVAKQGYGFDKLINDENEAVRAVARKIALKQKA